MEGNIVRIFAVDDMRATISSFFDFDAFALDEILLKYLFYRLPIIKIRIE